MKNIIVALIISLTYDNAIDFLRDKPWLDANGEREEELTTCREYALIIVDESSDKAQFQFDHRNCMAY